jgi:hypothetical protein
MTLSIKNAAGRCDALLTETNRLWRDLATGLASLIPKNMGKWAVEKGFFPQVVGGQEYWTLPDWLSWMVEHARSSREYPSGCSDKYKKTDLASYGFTSFADLKGKFAALEAAWDGVVKIKIDEEELPYRVAVHFYAAELIPAFPEPADE